MGKQTLVRVNKIESYRDLNESLGKKIELVEEHEDHSGAIVPNDVQAVVNSVRMVMQQIGPQMQMQIPATPKMILFLTEDEYDALDVPLDVNQTYQITFEGQAIKFSSQQEEPEQ
jgi:hypothetical protein